MTDQELLQDFVRTGSELAFSRLVERHSAFVYHVCRRETQDQPIAEEAGLAVFLILSQKAHTIRPGIQLTSWLFTTARLTAKNAARQERRRKAIEQKATEMAQQEENRRDQAAEFVDIYLNDALAALSESEREAVLLRYQNDLDIAEVGRTLGISEGAAQKRLSRGLEKMRRTFAVKGATLGIAVVISALLEMKSQAAPPAFYAKASAIGAAGLTADAHLTLVQKGTWIIMQSTKRKILASIVIAALVGTGSFVGWRAYGVHAPAVSGSPGAFIDVSVASFDAIGAKDSARTERRAIAAQLQRFTDGCNRHDIAGIQSIIAADASFRNHGGPSSPKAQVLRQMASEFNKHPDEGFYIVLEDVSLEGDRAATRERMGSNPQASLNKEGSIIWLKRNGTWLIEGSL